jgi:hypothetical protein
MNDCDHSTSRKPSKPKKNQVEFQVADSKARLSQRAIEAIARLLLSAPNDVRPESSNAIAA